MTVREMLDRISAYELSEWEAYEKACGPLDDGYLAEVLASVQEQLQFTCRLLGAQFGGDNPAPQPSRFPRPAQVFVPAEDAAEQEEPVGDADALNAFFDS